MLKINKKTHLLSDVEFSESTNCDLRPDNTDIDTIVIHCISLPEGIYGNDNISDLFQNKLNTSKSSIFSSLEGLKVSSHIFIKRTGELIQFVPFHKRAWHAGVSEYAGRTHYNDFSIGIELEGTVKSKYTDSQYEVLSELISLLKSSYNNIKDSNIIGHNEISPDRKEDPGPYFDWSRIK